MREKWPREGDKEEKVTRVKERNKEGNVREKWQKKGDREEKMIRNKERNKDKEMWEKYDEWNEIEKVNLKKGIDRRKCEKKSDERIKDKRKLI